MVIPDLFDTINKAEKKKIEGIQQAMDHANQENEIWSEKAYAALIYYAYIHQGRTYLAEEIREWTKEQGRVEDPPSKRAWGGVIARASRMEIIIFVGYAKTINPKAHRTPAALWRTGEKLIREQGGL